MPTDLKVVSDNGNVIVRCHYEYRVFMGCRDIGYKSLLNDDRNRNDQFFSYTLPQCQRPTAVKCSSPLPE